MSSSHRARWLVEAGPRFRLALFVVIAAFAATSTLLACGSEGAGVDGKGPVDSPSRSETSTSNDADIDAANHGDSTAPVDATDAGSAAMKCGSVFCREGASCVSGECELVGCTGATVPGDYATVQAAASALQASGGTICIGAGTFAEDVFVVTGPTPINIQGVSPDKTTVRSFSLQGIVTVKGLATTATVHADVYSATMSNVRFTSSTGYALEVSTNGITMRASTVAGQHGGIRIRNVNHTIDDLTPVATMLEGCDVSGGTESAIELDEPTSSTANAPVTLAVINSWVHDSKVGLLFSGDDGCPGTSCPFKASGVSDAISIVNDTFAGNATAILAMTVRDGAQTLGYFNTLIVDNALGVSVTGLVTQVNSNNLLFGNTTNYFGATDGPAYVKQDAHLDSASPPKPGPGSPARGAADAARAPATDFWGRPRGSKPDIGAVQGT
jgi:hypothetical protein